jgi:hypothetical protein
VGIALCETGIFSWIEAGIHAGQNGEFFAGGRASLLLSPNSKA